MNTSHLLSYCEFCVIIHPLQCDIPLSALHSLYMLLYPHQGAISSINDPYIRPGCWHMCASLYLGPHRRRVLSFTIASSILSHTNPHISEYVRFGLNRRCEAIHGVVAHAYATKIQPENNTKGVKLCLHSKKVWTYLYFFSLFTFKGAFSGVIRR